MFTFLPGPFLVQFSGPFYLSSDNKASIATSILEQISEMYKIESEIRGLDPGERMKYRQQKSKELVKNYLTILENTKRTCQ